MLRGKSSPASSLLAAVASFDHVIDLSQMGVGKPFKEVLPSMTRSMLKHVVNLPEHW